MYVCDLCSMISPPKAKRLTVLHPLQGCQRQYTVCPACKALAEQSSGNPALSTLEQMLMASKINKQAEASLYREEFLKRDQERRLGIVPPPAKPQYNPLEPLAAPFRISPPKKQPLPKGGNKLPVIQRVNNASPIKAKPNSPILQGTQEIRIRSPQT